MREGCIARYKARFVAYRPVVKDEVDYNEMVASVMLVDVLLLMVGKATSVGCHVNNVQISTAFLNGYIEVEMGVTWHNKI